MNSSCIVTLSENSLSYAIHDCLWVPCSAKFVSIGGAPNLSGVIQVHEIKEGKITLQKQVCRISVSFPRSIVVLYFSNVKILLISVI